MADVKMVVVDGVRFRLEDAPKVTEKADAEPKAATAKNKARTAKNKEA